MLTAITVITRISYLSDPKHIVDGDEAIIGIMAIETANLEYFPGFFHGQQYGLSTVEVLPAALFFKVFGVSDLALSVSILCLFILTVWFLYLYLRRELNSDLPAIAGCIMLILIPAMIPWSMKARGGYATALLCSTILLYLTDRHTITTSKKHWFTAGVVAAVSYFAQPLFLLSILPLLSYRVITRLKTGSYYIVFSLIPLSAALKWWSLQNNAGYIANPLGDWNSEVFYSLHDVFSVVFSGYFYLNDAFSAPQWVYYFAIFTVTGTIILFIINFIRSSAQSTSPILLLWFCGLIITALLLCLAQPFGLDDRGATHLPYRYGLPAVLIICVMFAYGIRSLHKKLGVAVLSIIILTGVISSFSMKNYPYTWWMNGNNSRHKFLEYITYMESLSGNCAFVTEPMFQHHIRFYSELKIHVRSMSLVERYPDEVRTVSDALFQTNPTIVTGLYGFHLGMDLHPHYNQNLTYIYSKDSTPLYFVVHNPPAEMLQSCGFEFSSR
jgi:hypothetical protein